MLGQTYRFISRHPLTRNNRIAALGRFARYQLTTRTRKSAAMPWFGGAQLVVEQGMSGASGNIYCGLHECADMAFLLHLLRPGDVFADVGANVGSFTVMASKVCGARTVAFEPDPKSLSRLRANLRSNAIEALVEIHEVAITDAPGTVRFSDGLDTTNHIIGRGTLGREVKADTLDNLLSGKQTRAIKIDVEGAELPAVRGATQTLLNSSLLAVEAEAWNPDVTALMQAHGFHLVHYDPFQREVSDEPGAVSGGNALFVRDRAQVERIVRAAPRRQVLPGQYL